MPIYSPTGFLDVTNATLRTSNLEAENFKLNGGNIYVSTDFTVAPTLQLITNGGSVTSNTVEFTNPTTGFVTTANIEVGTANLFVDTVSGRVGIGKTDPGATLDVVGDVEISGETVLGTATYRKRRDWNRNELAYVYLGNIQTNNTTGIRLDVSLNNSNSGYEMYQFQITLSGNDDSHAGDKMIYSALGGDTGSILKEVDIGYVYVGSGGSYEYQLWLKDPTTDTTGQIDVYLNCQGYYDFDTGVSDVAQGGAAPTNFNLGTPGVVVNKFGNVGIGTTNPQKLLEISGASGLDNSTPVHFRITNTQSATNGSPFTDLTKPSGLISFYTPDTSSAGPGDVAGIGFRCENTLGGDTALCFYTDGDNTNDPVAPLQERMCINHDGKVGIGTTNPEAALSISSPNTNGAALQIRNKLTAAIEETASYAYTNMRQKPNISGNDRALQFESYPYGAAGQNIMTWLAWNSTNDGWLTPITLTSSGNLTISGSYSPSDDRLKTNEAYIENATETLLKLKPQKYDKHNYSFLEVTPETYSNSIDGNVFIEPANIWVDANTFTYSTTDNVWYKRTLSDVTHEEAGLIAQDIWYDTPELRYIVSIPNDAQIPETKPEVSDDPTIDPDYENWGRKNATVNYTYLIPYLIKSNQELHTELQTVKARLDTLENA